MKERELQRAILNLAKRFGWRVAHFDTAPTRGGGWATPVQADGKGFPDLVMVRGDQLIFAELKGKGGRMRPEQDDWLDALRPTGALTAVWTPDDWATGAVEAILR